MANEKIVSSVYFRGTKVGSSEIDVIDTSLAPNYKLTWWQGGNETNNALDLTYNKTITLQVKQVTLRPDVTKVYYRYSGASTSKISLTAGTVKTGNHTGQLNLDGTGTGLFDLNLIFYPSLVDLDALLEVYHDPEMTNKFLTIPIRSVAVPNPKLRLVAGRSSLETTEVLPVGIFNNDILYIEYRDGNISTGKVGGNIPFSTTINGTVVNNGSYPQGGASWFYGNWYNDIPMHANGGWISLPRQRNPVQRGNVPMVITMGDLSVTNTLMDAETGQIVQNLLSFTSTDTFKNVEQPYPPAITDKFSRDLSIGYAFVKNSLIPEANPNPNAGLVWIAQTPSDTLSALTVNYSEPFRILPRGMLSNLQTALHTFGTSGGAVSYFAWNRANLTTANSRRQFGKYQKTLSTVYKWVKKGDNLSFDVVWSDLPNIASGYNNITLADVQDPVATAQYGALTTLDFNTLAAFTFTVRDASVGGDKFFVTGCVNLMGSVGTIWAGMAIAPEQNLPVPSPSTPNDFCFRIDTLFLRNNGRNEKNIFDDTVAYPRILNVQTVGGYEAFKNTSYYGTFWDVEIDPSLGINLLDSKYTFMVCVQNNSNWGFELWVMQEVYLVGRSANKLQFKAGWLTTNPSLSVAIVQTRP